MPDPNDVVSKRLLVPGVSWNEMDPDNWPAERLRSAKPFQIDRMAVDPGDLPDLDKGANPTWSTPVDDAQAGNSAGLPNLLESEMDTQRVADRASVPFRAIGKLAASLGTADRSGSAWAVGERTIITAGHCVFSDEINDWVKALVFMPQFAGAAVAGIWKAVSVFTLRGWAALRPGSRAFDIGGAVLDRPLPPAVGTLDWAANIAPQQDSFLSAGYPMDWRSNTFDFDGNDMWRCIGRQLSAGPVMWMANNMTRGASGGPWLINRNGRLFANGLNSFRLSDEPDALGSPYFGAGFINLVDAMKAEAG